MDIWSPLNTGILAVTAGILTWTAMVMRSATRHADTSSAQANAAAAQANAAATTLADIESQRRHSELCPRLRVVCEPWSPGTEGIYRLRLMLVGPPGLDRLDTLTVAIRDDHFRRGEFQQIMGGPTKEEIKRLIWGPLRFKPGIGPDDARADSTGRTVVYSSALPIGEELPYELEPTMPGHWMKGMSPQDWLRQRGTVMRLAFTAEHSDYGTWYLPCEVETATLPVTLFIPTAE